MRDGKRERLRNMTKGIGQHVIVRSKVYIEKRSVRYVVVDCRLGWSVGRLVEKLVGR